MIRTLALTLILAAAATGADRRDQAHSQRDFQRMHPCPATGKPTGAYPGYVVAHIILLKRVSLDAPSNVQWQTVAAAKAKDRVE